MYFSVITHEKQRELGTSPPNLHCFMLRTDSGHEERAPNARADGPGNRELQAFIEGSLPLQMFSAQRRV